VRRLIVNKVPILTGVDDFEAARRAEDGFDEN
jgi:hypothetical protein